MVSHNMVEIVVGSHKKSFRVDTNLGLVMSEALLASNH